MKRILAALFLLAAAPGATRAAARGQSRAAMPLRLSD